MLSVPHSILSPSIDIHYGYPSPIPFQLGWEVYPSPEPTTVARRIAGDLPPAVASLVLGVAG